MDVEKQEKFDDDVLEGSRQNPQDEVNVEIEEPVDEQQAQEQMAEEAAMAEQMFYANIAEEMDDTVLSRLGGELITDYKKDKQSRSDWEKAYTSGLDLLGFKYNEEARPFTGASSVTHPLLAESVTQFQAQAYKELLPSQGPVNTQVIGDITTEKSEQAQRVKDFMNYMLTDKMEEYTTDFDQLLFYLPLAGSAFKT